LWQSQTHPIEKLHTRILNACHYQPFKASYSWKKYPAFLTTVAAIRHGVLAPNGKVAQ